MQELKDDFFLNTYRECKAAFIASANSIIEKFPNSERITIKINKQAGKIDSLIIRY